MSQQFTLRSHKSSISYIFSEPNSPSLLYTSDTTGQIIKWDLITRRPLLSWQAHSDTILTITTIHDHLLTHSRDNTIKIWQGTDCILEIPCNALNFSNICVINNDTIITPASLNSNNLDVYRIDNTNDWRLTRLISDVNIYQLVRHGGIQFEEIGSRNDFGIVMKIFPIDDKIYVGYESGDIVGLQFIEPSAKIKDKGDNNDKLIINQSAKFIVKYHNSTHVPNPITCLLNIDNNLISGSTTNKIIIHKDPVEIIKVSNSGIQSLLNVANKELIIGFWNGEIQWRESIISRNNPMVGHSSNQDQDRSKSVKKLTFMNLIEPKDLLPSDGNTEGDKPKKYSQLIRSKKTLSGTLLLVGYEDGSIVAYRI